jgi:hypothetical protein
MNDGINIKEQSIVDANYTDFRSITEDALNGEVLVPLASNQ